MELLSIIGLSWSLTFRFLLHSNYSVSHVTVHVTVLIRPSEVLSKVSHSYTRKTAENPVDPGGCRIRADTMKKCKNYWIYVLLEFFFRSKNYIRSLCLIRSSAGGDWRKKSFVIMSSYDLAANFISLVSHVSLIVRLRWECERECWALMTLQKSKRPTVKFYFICISVWVDFCRRKGCERNDSSCKLDAVTTFHVRTNGTSILAIQLREIRWDRGVTCRNWYSWVRCWVAKRLPKLNLNLSGLSGRICVRTIILFARQWSYRFSKGHSHEESEKSKCNASFLWHLALKVFRFVEIVPEFF